MPVKYVCKECEEKCGLILNTNVSYLDIPSDFISTCPLRYQDIRMENEDLVVVVWEQTRPRPGRHEK